MMHEQACCHDEAANHQLPTAASVKISDTVVLGIPRSASSPHTVSRWSVLIAARTRSTFAGALPVAGLPEHGSLSMDSWPSLKHVCLTLLCAALTASSLKAFWMNHLNSLHRGMFKLNAKFDADSLLYSLSHFECNGHTVHTLTQWFPPPPLTSTVKLSLFNMHIPGHSPWLPGYIYVTQTFLLILTMAGLFLDRLCVCVCVCVCVYKIFTLETNIMLCINYISIFKKRIKVKWDALFWKWSLQWLRTLN